VKQSITQAKSKGTDGRNIQHNHKRGQETYGEDPFLTAKLGAAFIRGLQGNDPKYLLCGYFFSPPLAYGWPI